VNLSDFKLYIDTTILSLLEKNLFNTYLSVNTILTHWGAKKTTANILNSGKTLKYIKIPVYHPPPVNTTE
jgi:hypothetical protein